MQTLQSLEKARNYLATRPVNHLLIKMGRCQRSSSIFKENRLYDLLQKNNQARPQVVMINVHITRKNENSTEISKIIWELKRKKTDFKLSWRIIDKATPYKGGSELSETFFDGEVPNPDFKIWESAQLKKRSGQQMQTPEQIRAEKCPLKTTLIDFFF